MVGGRFWPCEFGAKPTPAAGSVEAGWPAAGAGCLAGLLV